ncbi:Ubiquitin-related domain,Ubiquitin domain [Cinara cedri]|uniref:Ubiquitin-related domain,Ubiquitin domain n=1 Tax=Cinara cedri TaxID=506608 RepID=A0A5E4MR81_9HEMI|nr:Ubiquitin-related domain,Ubiquitin domain [Cinara cedri]
MAIIEGFGDEVIQFFGILFIVVLIILIWMSTQVVDTQLFRGAAVFILERRSTRHTIDMTLEQRLTQSNASVPSISENPPTEIVPTNADIQTNSSINNDNPQDKNENSSSTENDVAERESTMQSNELSQSTNDSSNDQQVYEDSIKIRLKYLNDNCRLVEGRLQENIGVFKRRHFSNELSSDKIIRLIFQGKVLHDDEATLSSYGLHDNCVVHCLIHQPRPTTNAQQTDDSVEDDIIDHPPTLLPNIIRRRHRQRQPGPVQREWNLATLLSALITVIISLLWYARIHFYTLFSYTSTGTLGILTGIFIFTAILTFLVDNEDHQQYQPQVRQ